MPLFLSARSPKYLRLALALSVAPIVTLAVTLPHRPLHAQAASLLKPLVGPNGASNWKFSNDSKGWSLEEEEESDVFSLRSQEGASANGSISQAVQAAPGPLILSGEAKSEGAISKMQWDVQVFDAAWKQLAWITSEEGDAWKLKPSADWQTFRREISLPDRAAHAILYFSAQGNGAASLRGLALSPPNAEAANAQANTRISDTPRVQVLEARPYRWDSLLTGGVEYATGLVWNPKRPQDLFMRADGGGIWRFDRKADRWVALMDNLPWKWSNLATVASLAVDPNAPDTIYVAGGSSRWSKPHDLLKTRDGGKNWTRLHLKNARGEDVVSEGNGPDRQSGERLVIDPNDSKTLFFGSRNDGLFASRDAGQTWRSVASLPSNGAKWKGVSFVLFDPSSGRAGAPSQVLYAGIQGGKSSDDKDAPSVESAVFQSRDGGSNWRKLEGGLEGGGWGAASPMRTRLANGALYVTFAGGGGGGVWKWQGEKWSDITPAQGKGKPFSGINVDPRDPKRIITAGTYDFGPNIFLSRDGGATWSHKYFEKGNKPSGSIRLVEFPAWEAGHDMSWGGNASDVAFDPADPNSIWHLAFSGPTRIRNIDAPVWNASIIGAGREQMTTAEGVSPSSGAAFISGVWDVGGFRYEAREFGKIPETRLAVRKADGSEYTGYDAYRNGYQDIFDLDAAPLLPDHIAAAGGWMWNNTGDASLSSDNGRTFRVFASKPFPDAKFGRIAISATDPKNLVWAPMGGEKEAVYFTRDGGSTWSECVGAPRGMINTQGPWSFFKPLCADRVSPNTFYIYERRSGKFFRSGDGGATWAHLSTLPTQPGNHFDQHKLEAAPNASGDLWLSLQDQGLLHSSDGGKTWSKITGVDWAINHAFGKAMPGRANATIFLMGQINGQPAKTEAEVDAQLYRSDDSGKSWMRINGAERGLAQVNNLTGDMQTPGRVYIGTGGRGTFYGQPASNR